MLPIFNIWEAFGTVWSALNFFFIKLTWRKKRPMENQWQRKKETLTRVSLSKPNKRFALQNATRKEHILLFLKNMYRVHHFFKNNWQLTHYMECQPCHCICLKVVIQKHFLRWELTALWRGSTCIQGRFDSRNKQKLMNVRPIMMLNYSGQKYQSFFIINVLSCIKLCLWFL